MSLLNNNSVEFQIVEYLKTPLSKDSVLTLSKKLGLRPKDFIRKKEKDFIDNNLKTNLDNDDAMAEAIATFPKILERPIAVSGENAVIGRPPKSILTLT